MGTKYICNHPGIVVKSCAGCYEDWGAFIGLSKRQLYKRIESLIKTNVLVGKSHLPAEVFSVVDEHGEFIAQAAIRGDK